MRKHVKAFDPRVVTLIYHQRKSSIFNPNNSYNIKVKRFRMEFNIRLADAGDVIHGDPIFPVPVGKTFLVGAFVLKYS